jgi:hypothetical protein
MTPPADFSEFVGDLIGLLNVAIPVIITLTVMFVLWHGMQVVMRSDNPQKMAEKRGSVVWGILILFIMVSMWGLVNLLGTTFFGP